MSADSHQAVVSYPCRWEFKVIGFDPRRVREAIARVVGDATHVVADYRQSRSGKYCSVTLTLTVRDEAQRDGIFTGLRDNKDVIMVI